MIDFKLQELSFTLFSKDLSPGTIHPAILQYVEVIPSEWKLIENPVYSDREVKLVFENQVRLIVQPNKIFFAETIGDKEISEIHLSAIIQKYLKVFPRINYQALSIAPSGYQVFKSDLSARQYLSQNLLVKDPWQQFNGQNINAVGLKVSYPYKSGNFYLDINQANVEIKDIAHSAVWFAGNFNYQLVGDNTQTRLNNCQYLFQQWEQDVRQFSNFIEHKLLASIAAPELNLFHSNSL